MFPLLSVDRNVEQRRISQLVNRAAHCSKKILTEDEDGDEEADNLIIEFDLD